MVFNEKLTLYFMIFKKNQVIESQKFSPRFQKK